MVNNKTTEIKEFQSGYIRQVRAGKFGDDKVFIMYYVHPTYSRFNAYGSIDEGTIPKVYIINISTLLKLKDDVTIGKILMNFK